MTVKILMTPDSKKVVINLETDEGIYTARRNPPNTGSQFTRGTDLYRHVARSGNEYYYFVHWSMWQGEDAGYELVSKSEAESFFIGKMGCGYWVAPDDGEIERARELGFNLEEDA